MKPSYRGWPALQEHNLHFFDLCSADAHRIDRPAGHGWSSCLCKWHFTTDTGEEWHGNVRIRKERAA